MTAKRLLGIVLIGTLVLAAAMTVSAVAVNAYLDRPVPSWSAPVMWA